MADNLKIYWHGRINWSADQCCLFSHSTSVAYKLVDDQLKFSYLVAHNGISGQPNSPSISQQPLFYMFNILAVPTNSTKHIQWLFNSSSNLRGIGPAVTISGPLRPPQIPASLFLL